MLLSADGTSVFLQGTISGGRGTNAPPAKAFIDKVNIKTGEKTRVFEGENTTLQESISAILDADAKRLVLTRQNATTPPQQFLFDGTARKQLTNNEDLFPDLTRMIIQRFTVTRAGWLHVPHHGVSAGELPAEHAAAGLFLVLPGRVHVAGAVRQRPRRRRPPARNTTSRTSGRCRNSSSCASATP